jgi:hypothetical protein
LSVVRGSVQGAPDQDADQVAALRCRAAYIIDRAYCILREPSRLSECFLGRCLAYERCLCFGS